MHDCECFDFPVSWTFYRAHCIEQHGLDPGGNELPTEYGLTRGEIEVIESPPDLRRLTYQVEQARAEVLHLRTKLAEHLAQRRKRGMGGKYGYRGIE